MHSGTPRQTNIFGDSASSPEVVSFTELATYQRCPLEYEYRFHPRNRSFDPAGPEVSLGRLLHGAACLYLSRPIPLRRDAPARNIIPQLWNKYSAGFGTEAEHYQDLAMRIMDNMEGGPLSGLRILACEYRFKHTFGDFVLSGRVDCIARDEKGNLLVDFKLTSRELEHQDRIVDRYLQLIIYYLAVQDTIHLTQTTLRYYFFETGEFEDVECDGDLVKQGLQEVIRLNEERKKAEFFSARESYLCSTCLVKARQSCPLWKKEE